MGTPSVPTTLVQVYVQQMHEAAQHHPALLDVRLSSFSTGPVDELVENLSVIIEHMPFELGSPHRLGPRDPRRSQEKGVETWALPVVFKQKPGAEQRYAPDVLFNLYAKRAALNPGRPSNRRIKPEVRESMDRLARATALRIMGEDIGLTWTDGVGFTHTKSSLPVVVGFETPTSDALPAPAQSGDEQV